MLVVRSRPHHSAAQYPLATQYSSPLRSAVFFYCIYCIAFVAPRHNSGHFLIKIILADFVSSDCSILAQLKRAHHIQFQEPSRNRRGNVCSKPMEDMMCKNLVTITAALAILSLGSLASAQAGGATSASSKYNNATHTASLDQTRHHRQVQTADFRITEFSSSSAKSSVPHR
jgi:hypothetical protein